MKLITLCVDEFLEGREGLKEGSFQTCIRSVRFVVVQREKDELFSILPQ